MEFFFPLVDLWQSSFIGSYWQLCMLVVPSLTLFECLHVLFPCFLESFQSYLACCIKSELWLLINGLIFDSVKVNSCCNFCKIVCSEGNDEVGNYFEDCYAQQWMSYVLLTLYFSFTGMVKCLYHLSKSTLWRNLILQVKLRFVCLSCLAIKLRMSGYCFLCVFLINYFLGFYFIARYNCLLHSCLMKAIKLEKCKKWKQVCAQLASVMGLYMKDTHTNCFKLLIYAGVRMHVHNKQWMSLRKIYKKNHCLQKTK
jgi:hypothetical protein